MLFAQKITPFVFSGPCIGPKMNKINDSSNSCKDESENHREIKKRLKSKFKVVHRSCILQKNPIKVCSPHLYASFGTFYAKTGQLFEVQ